MKHIRWTSLRRTLPLSAVAIAAIIGGSFAPAALAAGENAGGTANGPIQDFNWLLDDSLLDEIAVDTADQAEGGEIILGQTTVGQTSVTQVRYTDLSSNYWASDFIYRLSAIQVVSGFPDDEFRPSAVLTKAQYAAMIAQAFDMPATRQLVSIQNLSRSYWAYEAIQTAYSMGFLDLDNGSIDVDSGMTRLDMLVMLARGLGITEVSSGQSVNELLSIFDDADEIPSQYRVIIAALVERGILVNYPQVRSLNLTQVVSRSEACAFMYQTLAYLGRVESIQSSYIVNNVNFSGLQLIRFNQGQTTNTTVDIDMDDVDIDDDDDDSDDRDDDDDDNDDDDNDRDDDDDNGDDDSDDRDDDDDDDDRRQNCNQGIGNGAEGCDPGNSAPRGGSNDEDGRTPGTPVNR